MSKWDDMPCLAFDIESTGISTLEDRIITAALVEIRPGHGRPTTTKYVVDPGLEVPEAASAVNGYTRARAIAEATHTVDQALFEIAGRIALWLGHRKPLVAFNAAFDLTMFEAECHRHGVEGLALRLGSTSKIAPVLDPFVLDKYASHRRGSRKLIDVCEFYGVRHVGAHDAGGDALAAGRLWPRVLASAPKKFQGQTLGGLHAAQIGWRRDQMNSLRAHFDRTGKAHDGCDPGWPLHTRVPQMAGGA